MEGEGGGSIGEVFRNESRLAARLLFAAVAVWTEETPVERSNGVDSEQSVGKHWHSRSLRLVSAHCSQGHEGPVHVNYSG